MEAIGVVVAVVVLVAVVAVAFARRRKPDRPEDRWTAGLRIEGETAAVRLEVAAGDPASPVLRRLATAAAGQVFDAHPGVRHVDVAAADGAHLMRIDRAPAGERKMADLPAHLYEPRRPVHAPDPVAPAHEPAPEAHFAERPARDRPLAEHFDLSADVRSRIADPDDPVGVIRAVLEAAGMAVSADGDVLRSGDSVVIVVRRHLGQALSSEDLNHAYHLFQSSGARRGIVVTPGILFPSDVGRRELLAPALRHAGPEAIQRMADAASLGADPLRFAAAA